MVPSKNEKASIFEGIPEDLPSLSYAYRLTQKAARLGFDWPDLAEVLKKMDEELGEFREALAQSPRLRGGAARSRSLRITTTAPAASPSQGRGKKSLLIRRDATPEEPSPDRRRVRGPPLRPGQCSPVSSNRPGSGLEGNDREVRFPVSLHRDLSPQGGEIRSGIKPRRNGPIMGRS
jgi:hypothetical protein